MKKFILEIIIGDADWRERRKAAEIAQIIAETPEGDARERELKRCREYYEKRRVAVAEAESDMGDKLSENYARLLLRAFPNDWESVIREFDASRLLWQKPRERLHFVSETFRKEAAPAFPQENRVAELERIRAAEIELRKNLP